MKQTKWNWVGLAALGCLGSCSGGTGLESGQVEETSRSRDQGQVVEREPSEQEAREETQAEPDPSRESAIEEMATPTDAEPNPDLIAPSNVDEEPPNDRVDGEGEAPDEEGTESDGEEELDLGFGANVDDLTVLVLFDRSGSMATGWDHRSRFEVASDTLIQIGIEPVQETITVGAILFPQMNSCDVQDVHHEAQFEFLLGTEFVPEWYERLPQNAPDGSTPLVEAFHAADTAIGELLSGAEPDERVRVVVVTDGEPTCATDLSPLTQLPAKWFELGVETYVFGLPGTTQAVQLLNDIAVAGGTGEHFAVGSPDELMEDLLPRFR